MVNDTHSGLSCLFILHFLKKVPFNYTFVSKMKLRGKTRPHQNEEQRKDKNTLYLPLCVVTAKWEDKNTLCLSVYVCVL